MLMLSVQNHYQLLYYGLLTLEESSAMCKQYFLVLIFSPIFQCWNIIKKTRDFPGGSVVKNPPANLGDTGSSPGPGRSHMPRSN